MNEPTQAGRPNAMRRLVAILDERFEQTSKFVRYGIVVGLTAFICWLDFVTPSYLIITGLYFFPIFLAAWYCGRNVLIAVFTAATLVNLDMTGLLIVPHAPFWQSVLAYASVIIVFAAFAIQMRYLKTAFGRLKLESRTDDLTGLRNRRGFIEAIESELLRKMRLNQALTLALIDIDNFKYVNDTQGHARGDALLVSVGQCISAVLRKVDFVGRMGGDEFAILLTATDAKEAAKILERLQNQLRIILHACHHSVSTSIGAVTVSADREVSIDELLDKADAAMYSVKQVSKDGFSVVKFDDMGAVTDSRG